MLAHAEARRHASRVAVHRAGSGLACRSAGCRGGHRPAVVHSRRHPLAGSVGRRLRDCASCAGAVRAAAKASARGAAPSSLRATHDGAARSLVAPGARAVPGARSPRPRLAPSSGSRGPDHRMLRRGDRGPRTPRPRLRGARRGVVGAPGAERCGSESGPHAAPSALVGSLSEPSRWTATRPACGWRACIVRSARLRRHVAMVSSVSGRCPRTTSSCRHTPGASA